MGFDDISNQKLRLGLGLGLGLGHGLQDELPENCMKAGEHCRQKKKEEDPCNKAYPSLTLGPQLPTKTDQSDECFHQQASSPSAVSSFSNSSSIKKERDQEFELDVEEKIPSRVVDIDENGNPRKKLRLTKEQSAVLEDSFKEHSTLNPVSYVPNN